ncbi:Bacterial Cytochrome Ubiquinol Oxidase [Serratia rubidaea]|uniref:Bacterial Cytochrome Ubiquinol Oxidase n=1 Tax=Serratia rubidaea TaxID=61652 RepID=A0A447QWL9_SERRU|nr:Bacterial Cytochrome Ubiquinol Oxidase [Serratia rubidaea]
MVAMGLLMILAGVWSLWLRWRGGLYHSNPFLYFVLWMGPSGLIALLAGWFTTEIGVSRGWSMPAAHQRRGFRPR